MLFIACRLVRITLEFSILSMGTHCSLKLQVCAFPKLPGTCIAENPWNNFFSVVFCSVCHAPILHESCTNNVRLSWEWSDFYQPVFSYQTSKGANSDTIFVATDECFFFFNVCRSFAGDIWRAVRGIRSSRCVHHVRVVTNHGEIHRKTQVSFDESWKRNGLFTFPWLPRCHVHVLCCDWLTRKCNLLSGRLCISWRVSVRSSAESSQVWCVQCYFIFIAASRASCTCCV